MLLTSLIHLGNFLKSDSSVPALAPEVPGSDTQGGIGESDEPPLPLIEEGGEMFMPEDD